MKKKILSVFGIMLTFSVFSQTTTTYNYTGAVQSYTVPCGVTTVTIDAYGAQGENAAIGGVGGLGSYTSGVLNVTMGDVLTIYVGGQTGYNGGGTAGVNGNPAYGFAGNGGGASDVRLNGTALANRVIVAGGGGGAGHNGVWVGCQVAGPAGNGGSGGGLIGGSGTYGVGTPCNCAGGGGDGATGGTQSAGGTHGNYAGNIACLRSNWTAGQDGTLAQGGSGSTIYYNGTGGGGGGGGGYYGGGSGGNGSDTTPGGGGGGGSSYLGTLTSTSTTSGTRSGDGMVVLTANGSTTIPSTPTGITGSVSFCQGSSVTFTISAVSGATNYTWTVPGGSIITAGQGTVSITMTAGSTSGTITVTADNCNGSSSPATLAVTVNPLPTVAVSPSSSTICLGASQTLVASGASTYSWSSGGNTANEIVSPSSISSYTVTGTDANGCVGTATATIIVNPVPTVSASSSASIICAGTNDTLTATGAMSYAWAPSGGNAAVEIISPSATTNYTVTGTDANGCMDTATISITVNALPVVNLGTDVTQCGGTITLDAQNVGSIYLWNDLTNNQTNLVSVSGIYSVDVTNPNGCINSDTIAITIHPNPTVSGAASSTTVCIDDANVILTGTPAGGTWSGLGVSGSNFTPMTAGNGAHTVTYNYSDAFGCSDSTNLVITVNACTGVNEIINAGTITIFPNPNNGSFTLNINHDANEMQITLSDISGRVIYSSVLLNVTAGNSNTINIPGLSAGVYSLQVSSEKYSATQRITIQK
ncbi:hypothetical protein BH09BAC5_BH09BAC5_09340 [soil metagenome]